MLTWELPENAPIQHTKGFCHYSLNVSGDSQWRILDNVSTLLTNIAGKLHHWVTFLTLVYLCYCLAFIVIIWSFDEQQLPLLFIKSCRDLLYFFKIFCHLCVNSQYITTRPNYTIKLLVRHLNHVIIALSIFNNVHIFISPQLFRAL